MDVILDPHGTALLDVDLDVIAAGGRIVVFGNTGGESFDAMPSAGRLLAGNVSVGGFSLSAMTVAAPEVIRDAIGRALALLASGKLRVAVSTVDRLDEVPAVHDALAEGRGAGKYVVRV